MPSHNKKPGAHQENFPGSNLDEEAKAFQKWMEDYQRRTGDKFPTWSTVLKEAHKMGYRISAKSSE